MKIIIESGATKADWRAISLSGEHLSVKSEGINTASMTGDKIRQILDETAPIITSSGETVSKIYFYAAGLIVKQGEPLPETVRAFDLLLKRYFPKADVEYASDLLAAARALCADKPGIVAILGTGSNSCLYDGSNIVRNIRSGGFILGDEGGAAALGRMFIADLIKDLTPESLATEFREKYDLDYANVVAKVYKGAAPSGYLGSFAPDIMMHYADSEYVRDLVHANFGAFFDRVLTRYDTSAYSVGITGTFAYVCREILEKIAKEKGVTISKILKAPIDGLVAYHSL